MLGLIAGGERQRAPTYFRYTVRADRDRARAIEAAARKAGLSVEAFVQRHFDGIVAPRNGAAARSFDPASFAVKHGLPRITALVLGEVVARADENGVAQLRVGDIVAALAISPGTAQRALDALLERGMLDHVDAAGRIGPQAPRFRIFGDWA